MTVDHVHAHNAGQRDKRQFGKGLIGGV